MFKRILIPIDNSKAAKAALDKAIALCKSQNATLRIVHALDYLSLGIGTEGIDTVTLYEQVKIAAEKLLKNASQKAAKSRIKVETALIESYKINHRIDSMILKEAKRWRADLVVVGTHNRRGLKKLIFGSESENLIHKITIPILLIHCKQ